jgi:hypothetical protein
LFDYDRREVKMVMGGNLDAKKRAELGFAGTDASVDLAPFEKDSNVLGVKVRCNGKDVTLMLDTGGSTTLLQVPAKDIGVKLPETAEGSVRGFFGEKSVKYANVSLSVGGLPPQTVEAMFLEDDQKIDYMKQGALGQNFLMRYNFLIDFPAKKLYLRPRRDLKRDQ